MCEPSIQWLQQSLRSESATPTSDLVPTSSLHKAADGAIEAFLVIVQKLLTWSKTSAPTLDDSSEMPDAHVKQTSKNLGELRELLSLDAATQAMRSCADVFNSLIHEQKDLSSHEAAIIRLRPFLEGYTFLLRSFIQQNAEWTRATFKLTFIVANIVQTLATKGFCQPADTDPNAEDAEGKAEATTEGTGLGEGSGMEDVSKEIEDESQVEGLQSEENESRKKGETGQEKDAIEMQDDFGGEMEDVEDDGRSQEDGSDDSEDDAPELDEKIADLDPLDPDAVDEKLWGDESKDDEKKAEETIDEDRSKEDQGKESDMGAKEDKKQTKKQEKEKGKDSDEKGEDSGENMDEDGGEEEEEFPEKEDEGGDEPQDAGARMDDHVKDAETLDLPENLELDDKEDGKDEKDDGGDMDELDDEDDEAVSQEGGQEKEPDFPDTASSPKLSENGDDEETERNAERAVPDETDAEDNPDADGAVAPPDVTGGLGDSSLGASSKGPQGAEHEQPQDAELDTTAPVDDLGKTAQEQETQKKPEARSVFFSSS